MAYENTDHVLTYETLKHAQEHQGVATFNDMSKPQVSIKINFEILFFCQ